MSTGFSDNLEPLRELLCARGVRMATAESCTGGGVAQLCTGLPGSSEWFECAFVTYSNAAKTRMLGVSAALIEAHGAVSEPVARAMAEGALVNSDAEAALSITGVAGPGGGSADKPVGTVWFAWAANGGDTSSQVCHFAGDRSAVRDQAAAMALQGMLLSLAHW